MRIASILATLLAAAPLFADEVTHPPSGLVCRIPDGWERDESREGGSIVMSIKRSPAADKELRFEVSIADSKEFNSTQWLESEKAARESELEVTEAFEKERDRTVGGKRASGYVVKGTVEVDGTKQHVRYRVFALVNGPAMVQITEIAYNDAEASNDALLDAVWSSVEMKEPERPRIDTEVPPGATETEFLDEKGNFKLKLPPGWEVAAGPPDTDDASDRLTAARTTARGGKIAYVEIIRLHGTDSAMFTQQTPTTMLESLRKNNHVFDGFYGKEANFNVEMDEGVLLGGAEKSGAYSIRDWTREQYDEIKKAEEEQSKGINVEIPNPPKIYVCGRIAMISPYVYLARGYCAASNDPENPTILAELAKIYESFEFLTGGARPPPRRFGEVVLSNTLDDPANTAPTARKFDVARKVFDAAKKDKSKPSAILEMKVPLPNGFVRIENIQPDTPLQFVLAAQDKNNGSVEIHFFAEHTTEIPPQANGRRPSFAGKPAVMEQWRSSWTAKARGKFPEDTTKKQFGGIRWDGVELKGTVDNFPATRQLWFTDQWGWRMNVEIETLGSLDARLLEGIKQFLKELKLKKA